MAKRNRASFQKRDRERRKAERATRKRARREQRKNAPSRIAGVDSLVDDTVGPVTEIIDAETSAQDAPS